MGSRKENLKKSLGISEYPWSSDEEENEAPRTDVHLLRRQSAISRPSVADMPGTSGQPPPPQPPPPSSPQRRSNPTEMERDFFWTLLNNHKMTSVPVPRQRLCDMPMSYVSRPHVPLPPEYRDPVPDRQIPSRDMQRLLAIKKLTRTLYSLRPSNTGRTQRNPIFNSSLLPDVSSNIRSRDNIRTKRLPPNALYMSCSRNDMDTPPITNDVSASINEPQPSTSGLPRMRTTQMEHSNAINSSNPEPTVNVDQSDDEIELTTTSPPVNEAENNEEDEIVDVDVSNNTSTGAMSLEEEIVEIDPEPDASANNETNVRQPEVNNSNENNNNEENVDANVVSEDSASFRGVKRKRDGPEESNDLNSVKELNLSLLRLLECPVCLEWMEPPMSQCRRGHLVCSRCRARLASCPVCRTTFSSVRNRAMEGVAEMLRYPCRHGCGREVRLRRRVPHEASCAARRYQCVAPLCAHRAPLPRDQLQQHLQAKHLSMLKMGRKHKFSMKVNSEQHDNWVIMALQEMFHLRIDFDNRAWGVIVYVAYIGPKCHAKNFKYEVTINGQHNARKLVYSRTTHSDLDSSSLNISRQDCFHLTLDQALNFLRFKNRHREPDNFLDFNIEISRSEMGEDIKEESDT